MTSLTLVRRIKARPSIVFDALTTPEGIASWWGPDDGPVLVAETDPQVGGRFRVRFRMLDGSEHESSGEYLEVVRPHRLVFALLAEKYSLNFERVTVLFDPRGTGCELSLTHETRLELAQQAQRDWAKVLDRLAAMLIASGRDAA